MKRLIPVALVSMAAIAAIVVTGCGSSSTKAATAASPSASSSSASGTVIKTRTSSIGKFLVDGQGRTLYMFEADKPDMSNCSGGCSSIWPALTAKGKPSVSGGVNAAKLGTAKSSNGAMQVTYNGWPLYYYAGDQKPGDTAGQGLDDFGAKWYVVSPKGSKIDDD
jgi:predicted lipoprotein with Yx(FWY)xxD motif